MLYNFRDLSFSPNERDSNKITSPHFHKSYVISFTYIYIYNNRQKIARRVLPFSASFTSLLFAGTRKYVDAAGNVAHRLNRPVDPYVSPCTYVRPRRVEVEVEMEIARAADSRLHALSTARWHDIRCARMHRYSTPRASLGSAQFSSRRISSANLALTPENGRRKTGRRRVNKRASRARMFSAKQPYFMTRRISEGRVPMHPRCIGRSEITFIARPEEIYIRSPGWSGGDLATLHAVLKREKNCSLTPRIFLNCCVPPSSLESVVLPTVLLLFLQVET